VRFWQSRLAVAALLLPILYLLISYLPSFLFFLLVSAAILRAQYEFYRLYFRQNTPLVYLGLCLGFLLLCWLYFTPPLSFALLAISILLALLIFQLFFFQHIQNALLDSSVLFMGIFYLACFLGHCIAIRQQTEGVGFIFFLLFVIWGGDAGAYYVGRSIGGMKLYPVVSPNKTVSGAIGGLLISVAGGVLARRLFIAESFPFTWGEVVLLSLILGGVGQLGDLVESLFKRSAGVKDSSGLVPAHGGLLDKLDGVAFAAPLLYYYLVFIQG
jgi:phosphatidate cytidylyltransferase